MDCSHSVAYHFCVAVELLGSFLIAVSPQLHASVCMRMGVYLIVASHLYFTSLVPHSITLVRVRLPPCCVQGGDRWDAAKLRDGGLYIDVALLNCTLCGTTE